MKAPFKVIKIDLDSGLINASVIQHPFILNWAEKLRFDHSKYKLVYNCLPYVKKRDMI